MVWFTQRMHHLRNKTKPGTKLCPKTWLVKDVGDHVCRCRKAAGHIGHYHACECGERKYDPILKKKVGLASKGSVNESLRRLREDMSKGIKK